jgi:hypothetical protein
VTAVALSRRVRRLEQARRGRRERVRCVWWRGGEPYPEPAEGERLVVLRRRDEDDDAPSVPAPAVQPP